MFISAAEREIHTGDGISLKVVVTMFLHLSWNFKTFKFYNGRLEMQVITKDGIKCQELPLRRD